MKKIAAISCFIFLLFSTKCMSASYDYLDIGEQYYLNGFFKNEQVEVLRKLDSGQIKVRILSTGETKSVPASDLLTKSELNTEETVNAVKGTILTLGLLYCITHPNECK